MIVWLRAAVAVLVIAALAVGVPWLLIGLVGNPYPSEGISLSAPLTDNAVLGLVAVVAWAFWAQMMACLVVEAVAEARIAAGRTADWMIRVPGTFGAQQHLCRLLVQAVVAVGVGAGVATSQVATYSGTAASMPEVEGLALEHTASMASSTEVATPRQTVAAASAPILTRAEGRKDPANRTVTVRKGDTLWGLAERHLGSGEEWKRIARLNDGRLMPDGERFIHASSILPGWQLLMPPDATELPTEAYEKGMRSAEAITVTAGDSLWELAEEEYGDGARWRRLYDANRGRIANPDLIHPGQVLAVPSGEPNNHSGPSEDSGPGDPDRSSAEPPAPRNPPPATMPPSAPQAAEPTQTDEIRPGVAAPDAPAHAAEDAADLPGLVSTLVGGGALLAGGVAALLMAHRRRQFRRRGSGRTIAPTPQPLIATEQTVLCTGPAGRADAEFLNSALLDLSTRIAHQTGETLPPVAAARLNADRLELLLGAPPESTPPAPWQVGEDGRTWSILRTAALDPCPALAPYPTLAAIGVDESGATWLLDLEAAGVLCLQGEQTLCEETARFLAAELAVNAWSETATVTLTGFGDELVNVNPNRLRHKDALVLSELLHTVGRVAEATEGMGQDVLAGRLDGRGGDTWMPRILLAGIGDQDGPALADDLGLLLKELDRRERSAVALVLFGDVGEFAGGLTLTIDADGALSLPPWDASLTANRLTAGDARDIAALLANADRDEDAPMPPSTGSRPYEQLCDAAGAICPDLTTERGGKPADTLLPLSDQEYLDRAATTTTDLAALAPVVPSQTRDQALALDPTLDDDLAAWRDPDTVHPRIRLLGPVEVHARGERSRELDRRPAYFTEVVTYLATRDHGATPQQTAEAFGVQTNTMHSRVGTARKWLGTNPMTGNWYLPESTLSPSAKARGVPIYELVDVLCDADLFRRLRVRGQARGPEGIKDLRDALALVQGKPFDQLRPGGYGWLAETPVDHYLTAAVVDVAHILATHGLGTGDLELARWAAETAIIVAPSEDRPRLDLATVLAAEGNPQAADQYLTSQVVNRDDDAAPPELTDRVAEILKRRGQQAS